MFALPLGGREQLMPTSRIHDNAAFDPQAIKALAAAYDDACTVLHVMDSADPRATIVAKKIIEHAQHGEPRPRSSQARRDAQRRVASFVESISVKE